MFNLKRSTKLVVASGLLACVVLVATVISSGAAGSTLLGTAQSFAVLGGSEITNTGSTTVEGNLGVSPGSAVTGFPPGEVSNGTIHITDGEASQAQSDVTTAYNTLAGMACDDELTGQDLGGLTLDPGVYCFTSFAQLTGDLTLNAQGDPDALFVFQIASTLITASDSAVSLIGGLVCTVYWQVGSSATLGTDTTFVGNILSLTSITLNTRATIAGRALARNGAVTMDTNDVSAAACITNPTPTATPETSTATAAVPTATTDTSATATGPASTSTPTAVVPTATSEPQATTSPPPNTPAPVTPVPPTATSMAPVLTATSIVPIPGPPSALTPTAASTIEETAAPTASAVDTSTAVASVVETSVPSTETVVATVDATFVETTQTPGDEVGTPVEGTPGTPTATLENPSSTPIVTITASPVPPIFFPNTGSGGLLGADQAPLLSLTELTIVISIIMLMTGGLGIIVEKRNRL